MIERDVVGESLMVFDQPVEGTGVTRLGFRNPALDLEIRLPARAAIRCVQCRFPDNVTSACPYVTREPNCTLNTVSRSTMRPDDPELSRASDDALVQAIRDGDEAALGILYRRYVQAIYRFVLAQVRDMEDAEDLTSDTFARMLHGIGQFRGEASFKNWLYQIARNAVRNHRRAAGYRRNSPLTANLALAEVEGEAGEFTGQAEIAAALELLQPLPPRYRQVLELRFLNGLSIEETAGRMGVTAANAKVLQHRALKKAALIMEEQHVESGRSDH